MARFSTGKTLVDIRQNFVNSSGRVDLVDDVISYGDNGADYFIQRGSEYLDFEYLSLKSVQRYQYDILSGEYFHQIPNLIGIYDIGDKMDGGVWLSKSDAMKRLQGGSFGWVRQNFSRPVSAVTTAEPSIYSLVHSHLAESQLGLRKYEAIETFNGTFDDAVGWTIAAGFTIGNGKMTNGGTEAGDAELTTSVTNAETYLLEFEVLNMTAGSITLALGTASYTASANGPHRVELVPTDNLLEVDCTAAFDGSIDNITLKRVSNEYSRNFTYDFEDVHFAVGTDLTSMYQNAGLLLMAPADGRYTITLFGYFRSKLLSADTDVNFWSVNHPDALLQASIFALELTYRNTQGQKDALNGLSVLMNPLEKMRILAQPTSGTLD